MKQTIIDLIKTKQQRIQIGTFNKNSCETIWINGSYKITTNEELKTYEHIVKSLKSDLKKIIHKHLNKNKLFDETNLLTTQITDTIKPNRTTFLKFEFFVKTKDNSNLNVYINSIKSILPLINEEVKQSFINQNFRYV